MDEQDYKNSQRFSQLEKTIIAQDAEIGYLTAINGDMVKLLRNFKERIEKCEQILETRFNILEWGKRR